MLPIHLKDIPLGKWIEYCEFEKESSNPETDDEKLLFAHKRLCKFYAFFMEVSLEDVYKNENIVEILKDTVVSQCNLNKEIIELGNINLVDSVFEGYKIVPPIDSVVTLQDFEISQEIALLFNDLQEGNLDALLDLCRMYLREENDTERKENTRELMKVLPLSVGLCVKMYIEETINLYLNLSKGDRNAIAT